MRYKKIIVIAIILGLTTSSCMIGRFVFYNFSGIDDHKIFPSRPLNHSETPFHFTLSENGKHPKKITIAGKEMTFEDFLSKNRTVAFLIIRNDSLLYENYFHGYKKESTVASFSMAKSVVSILIGCAIEDGFIGSVQDPVTRYIPELEKNGLKCVTLEHLLQMTSGIAFSENYYLPFSDAAVYYYGTNLKRAMKHMHLKRQPGTRFEYISGNTQLLGWVLERALKDKSVTSYLQEKLWSPMQMEYDASWSVDNRKHGTEKAFCCLNARARDFAKIGRLYLNKGNWNGKQLVPEKWVRESTRIDTTNGSVDYYRYQWWLTTWRGDFMAQGHLGQYIYVNPASKLVIVRLGTASGKCSWWSLFPSLAKEYLL